MNNDKLTDFKPIYAETYRFGVACHGGRF